MASRRMFSIKMIDSAKFLKMPSSTRLLYYDLGMRADDDGVVEAFNVLRMTGATEDDLRILVAKNYIKILNEDLVSFIVDWKEHNKIRADRKVDSMYKDLLLKILPETQLLETKPRADRKNNGTSQGQPKDGIGQVSLGEDRSGKDSLGKVSLSSEEDMDLIDDDFKEEIKKIEEETLGSFTIYDCKKLLKAANGDVDLVLHIYEKTLSMVSDENPIKNLVTYLIKAIENELEE